MEAWTYTQYGQVLSYDGPRTDVSDVTKYSYYTATDTATPSKYRIGDLKTITDPLGFVTTYNQYSSNGQPLQKTDPNGVITKYTYDERQRLKTSAVNLGGTTYDTTTLIYLPTGQLQRIAFQNGVTIWYGYDSAHRFTGVSDGFGSLNYRLDGNGNATWIDISRSSGGVLTRLQVDYDALNRVQRISVLPFNF